MHVALRKESVDRNIYLLIIMLVLFLSLSARRAWIEMSSCCRACATSCSRSPQGERG